MRSHSNHNENKENVDQNLLTFGCLIPEKQITKKEPSRETLIERKKTNVLKQFSSMNSAAFAEVCESPQMKRNQSFEKELEKEKIKLQLERFEKQSPRFKMTEKMLAKEKNDYPKCSNLRQLKRKCNIFRFKETMEKIETIQNTD